MFWPMTKNEAGTSNSSRTSRTLGVVGLVGPSSKLNATSMDVGLAGGSGVLSDES